MIKRLSLLALVTLMTLLPLTSRAETGEQLSVSVSPTNPGPGQLVTVTLSSYAFNLQTAQVFWSATGQPSKSGTGLASYSFTAKAIGSPTTVNATVTPVGGLAIKKSIVVTPLSVDMLWEATDALVPPFYRGKAMATSESNVKFVAIPQVRSAGGTYLAPSSFTYDWKEEYASNAAKSGYGKNSYAVVMDYLNPTKHIGVDVSSRDGSLSTSGAVTLESSDPMILWYAASPLYGPLYDHALSGSYAVEGSDTSLVAEPYFFSPRDAASPTLKYAWTLNGAPLETPIVPNSLFLHRDGQDKGSAKVSVRISSISRLFHDVTSELSLSLQ